jgi:oxygen-independent coproporphyrinogen-3 oxidase
MMQPLVEGVAVVEQVERVEPELLVQLSKAGPRYTSYPTAPVWDGSVGQEQLRSRLEQADTEGPESPLSLYFHIPFCEHMCTYCGCNVVVARRQERADLYLDHVALELDQVARHLPRRRRVIQLHLGGGTPTFLKEEQILRLWSLVTERFEIDKTGEIALEIDPVVTSTEQLALLRGLGFNRVSMGIQDFTPDVQEYVGRVQSVELTGRLHDYARRLGFRGINFDLIYGLPKQRPETFARTLDRVLEMAPDRVAVFSYAHVPWMRPAQRAFDEALLPSPVEKLQLFALAMRRFLEAGYVQIGMDHFARPDDELARARLARELRRNFQGYTVLPASDIVAFGITGISDVQGCYAQNLKPLAHYYRRLEAGELPVERGWVLSPDDLLRRDVIHGIMCNFHLDLAAVCAGHGVDAREHFADELRRLADVERDGLVEREDLVLQLTPLGRVLVRNVAMIFDPYLQQKRQAGQTFSKTI